MDKASVGFLNCLLILSRREFGNTVSVYLDAKIENLTNPLAKLLGLKRSFTSPSLARLISVSATYRAFFENHNVATMTIPEMKSNIVGVGTLVANTSILNSVAATPETVHAS